MPFLSSASDTPWHVLAIGALLLLICAGFLIRFVLPALGLGRTFRLAVTRLEGLRQEGHYADPEAIAREVMTTPLLAHLWREYAQTLHRTRVTGGSGDNAEPRLRWRATTLAETFFTEQALVDTPLRVEFYKHLPGILTGIGIIGTFSGLILGLTHFEVSANTDVVRGSLKELIQGVGHAFKISAAAIGLAMLLTWIEKSLVVARYRQVERLNQAIDALFDTGIGEEYLARLVGASEASAQQASQLRQALAGEMRQALAALVEQQQQAAGRSQEALAASIAKAVSDSLKEPMGRIAAAMEKIGADQGSGLTQGIGQAVGGALEKFSQQFNEQMARQNWDNGVRQESLLKALEEAGERFREGSARIEDLAKQAVETFSSRFSGQFAEAVASLSAGQQAQQTRLSEQSDVLMGKVASHLQAVVAELKGAAGALQGCVGDFNRASAQAVERLAEGARAVQDACTDFASAGRGFQEAAVTVAGAGKTIDDAATSLVVASTGTGEILAEQQRLGETLAQLLPELGSIVAAARREASFNTDVVARLESAAQALALAEQRADTYLQGVSAVLAKSHEAFAANVERSLKESNTQFHRELAEAVGYLKGAIEHLGDVLETGVR